MLDRPGRARAHPQPRHPAVGAVGARALPVRLPLPHAGVRVPVRAPRASPNAHPEGAAEHRDAAARAVRHLTVLYAVVRAGTTGHHVRVDLGEPVVAPLVPARAGGLAAARAGAAHPAGPGHDRRAHRPRLGHARAGRAGLHPGPGAGAAASFFVLGAMTPPSWLRLLRRRELRWAGAVVLAGTAIAVAVLRARVDGAWQALFWNDSYAARAVKPVHGLLTRAMLYLVGAAPARSRRSP